MAERRLANGLTLFVATLPAASYFEVRLIARHHSDRETAREFAVAHREGHAADLIRLVTSVDSQTLQFQLKGEPNELERALDLVAKLLHTPPWSEDLEWARQQREQGWPSAPIPDSVDVIDRLRARLLGISVAGETPEPEGSISREQYQARMLNPAQSAVVIVSPLGSTDVLAQAESRLAAIARRAVRGDHDEPAALPPTRGGANVGSIVFIPSPRYLARVAFGVRVPTNVSASRIELVLLADMIGNGVSAFMHRELRETLGLTRQVQTTLELTPRGDMLYGWLVTAPERLKSTLKALRAALIHLRTKQESLSLTAARERTAARLRDARLRVDPLASRLATAFAEERALDLEAEQAELERLSEQQMRLLASRVLPRPLIIVMAERSTLAALQWDPAEVEYAPTDE